MTVFTARVQVVTVVALSTSLLALASGCGSSRHSGPAPSSPATRTPTPTSTINGDQAAALAAYTGMWNAAATILRTAPVAYDSPLLTRYATGSALSTFQRNMYDSRLNGVITKGQPITHPQAVAYRAGAVDIQDCLDDTGWLTYYVATGKLTDNIPGGHRHVTATVIDTPAGWKVSTLQTGAEGTC